jgi:general nucleoside transport system permease protein
VTGSATVGLLWGLAVGLVVAVIHGNLSHRLQANTFVVGLTINVLALGLTNYLSESKQLNVNSTGKTRIPGLSDIPWIGKALFDLAWPAYLLVAVVPAAWWVLMRSRWGLEARASGENPKAADVTGAPVNKRRRQALLLSGGLSGLAGAYLSICEVSSFTTNMGAGRGYLVIAAVIFGGWTLRGALLGCFLFGFADALQLALPAIGDNLNPQLLISAPYVLALLAMCFFAKRARQPAAAGQPFERGAA